MKLDEAIREAARLVAFDDNPDYLRGISHIVARTHQTELNIIGIEPSNREGAVEMLIRAEVERVTIIGVRIYHDTGSDPQFIDIRVRVITTHGEWQQTRTLDTADGIRSDSDLLYAEDGDAPFEDTNRKAPAIVRDLILQTRIAADVLADFVRSQRAD